jgi:hypothetical protein
VNSGFWGLVLLGNEMVRNELSRKMFDSVVVVIPYQSGHVGNGEKYPTTVSKEH